ncbi:hypothetical protein, partial [Mycobacterium sp.]|uniref:hypothetical protein n=1 Tax=Mycobacterium sp. TaxID=1785 RepID=UPI0025F04072
FGSWSTGVAWSTIKVPLAIAALRADRARAEPLVVKAITASDNRAAAQLWTQLGPAAQAARQVQRVIRESGDGTTVVQMRRLRPGFSAFGQTPWALNSQARFAAHLPCLSDTTVLDLMHRLVDEQRWGLAAQGAAAKGGWGPTGTGGYLVRQFGVMPNGPAKLGVALAA